MAGASLPSSSVPRTSGRQDTQEQLDELVRVTLLAPAESDDGDMIPAGTIGTIVAVWSGGNSYDVDFAGSVPALATVSAAALKRA